jgi:hypothetical protein
MQAQRSSFYVAVTRVKSMQRLFLLEPLTLDFFKYFTPSQAALGETLCLQRLELVCDRRHRLINIMLPNLQSFFVPRTTWFEHDVLLSYNG